MNQQVAGGSVFTLQIKPRSYSSFAKQVKILPWDAHSYQDCSTLIPQSVVRERRTWCEKAERGTGTQNAPL